MIVCAKYRRHTESHPPGFPVMQALKSITQRMREQVADWSGPFLILHIGTHKTGTTWLQKLFLENRKLLSKNGLLLPDAGRDPRLGHSNNLGWELKRSWRFHPARGGWQALAEELRRCDPASSALISAESLGRIEEPEALRKIMDTARGSGRRVLVVVYLRDQPSYINSLYGQEVKRLLTGDSFERYVRDALVSNRFNHEHLLRVWEHLDEVALLPIPFAKCSMPLHRSFFGALEAAVGLSIPVEKLTLPEPRNESPGPGAVRLARSVHAALRGMACGKAERFTIYDALRREFIRRLRTRLRFADSMRR